MRIKNPMINALAFERCKETLHRSNVIAITRPFHAESELMHSQQTTMDDSIGVRSIIYACNVTEIRKHGFYLVEAGWFTAS